MKAFLIIAGCTLLLIYLATKWVEAIDYMHRNYPDYKGEDLFDNENLGFLNQWEDKPIDIGGQNHRCEAPNESKDYIYGCAIWVCYENELDELVVENGEYGSQVNYCPYCGYEAKNKIKKS